MKSDKINFYINSKYTHGENKSKVNINIPSGLLKLTSNEYFTMSVTGFYCFNTLYQLSYNNNTYLFMYRDINNNIFEPVILSLTCVGNPTVHEIRDNLNTVLTEGNCVVVYDKIINAFVYMREKPRNNNYYKMFIMPINCGNFLGLPDNEEFEITSDGSISYPINVVANKTLYFNVDGDIQLSENNFHNIKNLSFQPSNIIFYKNIDVGKNKLLVYDNEDSNMSFEYTLLNTQDIHSFDITIFNQDGDLVEDMPDWSMCIQFTKNAKDDSVVLLKQIKEYLSYIFLFIGNYLYPPK